MHRLVTYKQEAEIYVCHQQHVYTSLVEFEHHLMGIAAEDLLQMQKCIQFVIVFIYKIRHPTKQKFAIKISNTLSVYR